MQEEEIPENKIVQQYQSLNKKRKYKQIDLEEYFTVECPICLGDECLIESYLTNQRIYQCQENVHKAQYFCEKSVDPLSRCPICRAGPKNKVLKPIKDATHLSMLQSVLQYCKICDEKITLETMYQHRAEEQLENIKLFFQKEGKQIYQDQQELIKNLNDQKQELENYSKEKLCEWMVAKIDKLGLKISFDIIDPLQQKSRDLKQIKEQMIENKEEGFYCQIGLYTLLIINSQKRIFEIIQNLKLQNAESLVWNNKFLKHINSLVDFYNKQNSDYSKQWQDYIGPRYFPQQRNMNYNFIVYKNIEEKHEDSDNEEVYCTKDSDCSKCKISCENEFFMYGNSQLNKKIKNLKKKKCFYEKQKQNLEKIFVDQKQKQKRVFSEFVLFVTSRGQFQFQKQIENKVQKFGAAKKKVGEKCIGCSGCFNCDGCQGCTGCKACNGCLGCQYCEGCSGCSGCEGCPNCIDFVPELPQCENPLCGGCCFICKPKHPCSECGGEFICPTCDNE